MTDLITDMCEKIFDCVTIHLAVFKSLLSRKYERRIDKRKKTLPVYRKIIKKLQEDLIIMKRTTKREGFTLVELLIVIVVIGILSAMMMLSSTEAVSSAKASNIVSNLRNLKTAALAYYTDHLDDYSDEKDTVPDMSDIWKYMNNTIVKNNTTQSNAADTANYTIEAGTDDFKGGWFLVYKVDPKTGSTSEQTRIKEKLKGRAKSVGLLKGKDKTNGKADYDGTTANVYYLVR